MRDPNPCAAVAIGAAELLHKTKLQFTMLQREKARRILNQADVEAAVKSVNEVNFNFNATNFEDSKISIQVQRMREADILLAVHGAGFTNVVSNYSFHSAI